MRISVNFAQLAFSEWIGFLAICRWLTYRCNRDRRHGKELYCQACCDRPEWSFDRYFRSSCVRFPLPVHSCCTRRIRQFRLRIKMPSEHGTAICFCWYWDQAVCPIVYRDILRSVLLRYWAARHLCQRSSVIILNPEDLAIYLLHLITHRPMAKSKGIIVWWKSRCFCMCGSARRNSKKKSHFVAWYNNR